MEWSLRSEATIAQAAPATVAPHMSTSEANTAVSPSSMGITCIVAPTLGEGDTVIADHVLAWRLDEATLKSSGGRTRYIIAREQFPK